MEFDFQNAYKRVDELGSYYTATESEIIKLLIRDCIEKTVNATSVYENFTAVANESFKKVLKSEEKFLTKWMHNLKTIEDINNDLSKSEELDQYTNDMKKFLIENENDMKLLSYQYVTFMKSLTVELLEERGKILFNQILKIDLSEFKTAAIEKFTDKILEKLVTSFPVLGELYDKILFTYDTLIVFDINNSIKEMLSNSDPIIVYLENYNKQITNYINELKAISIVFEEYDFNKLRDFDIKES